MALTDSEWVDSDKPDRMVDEFEQWKKQQKALAKKGIPPDEAPSQPLSEVGNQQKPAIILCQKVQNIPVPCIVLFCSNVLYLLFYTLSMRPKK